MRRLNKSTLAKSIVPLALVGALAFGGSSLAFAASRAFSYPLPEFQENVSVFKGSRQLSNNNAYVSLKTSTNNRAVYFWVDGPSVNTKITASVRLTLTRSSTMPYTNKGQGTVILRACTDGWQSGTTNITGNIDFNR